MKYKIAVAVLATVVVLTILHFSASPGLFSKLFKPLGPALESSSSEQSPAPKFPIRPLSSIPLNPTLSLITEPDDGTAPIVAAINNASTSIDVTIYEISSSPIMQALRAAVHRGVAVRVLLDHGYQGKPSAVNAGAYNYFHSNSVSVRWSSPAFTFTHEKSISIDGVESIIMSFNLTTAVFTGDRDFGLVDRDPHDVAGIETTFDDDWNAASVGIGGNNDEAGDDLVWSPGSEDELIALIASARTSLDVYNEEMDDTAIEAALEAATRRGVRVRVVMTYASTWQTAFAELTAAGVAIRTYSARASLYIHAKVIVADAGSAAARAFVGSENFSATSLYYNRELGIIFLNSALIGSITQTFEKDWNGAK